MSVIAEKGMYVCGDSSHTKCSIQAAWDELLSSGEPFDL